MRLDWVYALALKREIWRAALLAWLLLASTGCDSLRMNEGKITSVLAAAQVGKFKRDKGSWPTGISELIAHGCPGLDDDAQFVIDAPPRLVEGCQFFANFPYRLEMTQRAPNLQMESRSAAGKLICRILVIAPANSSDALIPQVELRTSLFTCPGEGKPL